MWLDDTYFEGEERMFGGEASPPPPPLLNRTLTRIMMHQVLYIVQLPNEEDGDMHII